MMLAAYFNASSVLLCFACGVFQYYHHTTLLTVYYNVSSIITKSRGVLENYDCKMLIVQATGDNETSGLYYKTSMIVIYDRNDSII